MLTFSLNPTSEETMSILATVNTECTNDFDRIGLSEAFIAKVDGRYEEERFVNNGSLGFAIKRNQNMNKSKREINISYEEVKDNPQKGVILNRFIWNNSKGVRCKQTEIDILIDELEYESDIELFNKFNHDAQVFLGVDLIVLIESAFLGNERAIKRLEYFLGENGIIKLKEVEMYMIGSYTFPEFVSHIIENINDINELNKSLNGKVLIRKE